MSFSESLTVLLDFPEAPCMIGTKSLEKLTLKTQKKCKISLGNTVKFCSRYEFNGDVMMYHSNDSRLLRAR